eukprot:TRINITY_DN1934_c0_g1_i12.p1 TRINITY_DN1934_c0_g1~~TRINITY_DN1934_c0_g1_i12.p1  ORF type:complete len:145 (-),score=8.04 TRINITY_DN1934_c0_g1_i12:467-901(-)
MMFILSLTPPRMMQPRCLFAVGSDSPGSLEFDNGIIDADCTRGMVGPFASLRQRKVSVSESEIYIRGSLEKYSFYSVMMLGRGTSFAARNTSITVQSPSVLTVFAVMHSSVTMLLQSSFVQFTQRSRALDTYVPFTSASRCSLD